MIKFFTSNLRKVSVFTLAIAGTSCGGDDQPVRDLSCRENLAACEYMTRRKASDIISMAVYLKDCAYDYGVCIRHPDNDCEELCSNVDMAATCVGACERL